MLTYDYEVEEGVIKTEGDLSEAQSESQVLISQALGLEPINEMTL